MEFQKIQILDRLKKEGWNMVRIERPETNSFWWAVELIELWNEDSTLYLSFLVDPGCNNSTKKAVSVGFSRFEPRDFYEAINLDMFYLNNKWSNEFNKILGKINAFVN